MANVGSLRERKKLERRRRIEDVAIDLFERDGFEATTIEDIAEAAEIAPRTFFSYFASKDDVVLADYADRLDRILGELSQRPADESAWTALQSSFAAVSSDYAAQADRIGRRFAIMAANPSIFARSLQLQAGWEDTLSEHLTTRLTAHPEDPTPRLLAATSLAVMRASLQHWLTNGRTAALPGLVQQAFAQLGDGLEDAASLARP